jgi:hypothetical protein
MATMASIRATYRLWNWDLVGALNMLHILWSLRHAGRIPQRFRRARLAPATNFPVQLPLNHTKMRENGKSVRGLLYWFNQGSDVNPLFSFPTLSP